MKDLPSLAKLTESFHRLPGVGIKSAERMAYAVLDMEEDVVLELAENVKNVKKNIKKCEICGLYTENDSCEICSSPERSHDQCIVVAYQKDALAFEKIGTYKGVYHVLGGLITPSKGIGPDDIAIDALSTRIEKENIKELIVATNPTLEGETTALFISSLFEGKGIKITRLAYGLPMGASLDYADSLTLAKALEGRKEL